MTQKVYRQEAIEEALTNLGGGGTTAEVADESGVTEIEALQTLGSSSQRGAVVLTEPADKRTGREAYWTLPGAAESL